MRILVVVVLILHGLVHLLGFVVPWKLASIEGLSYKTTILSGTLDIGATGARLIGLVWLLAAIGFVIAGIAILIGYPGWVTLTLIVTTLSLVLTILGWPDSQFGLLVNIIILVFLFFGEKAGWLSIV